MPVTFTIRFKVRLGFRLKLGRKIWLGFVAYEAWRGRRWKVPNSRHCTPCRHYRGLAQNLLLEIESELESDLELESELELRVGLGDGEGLLWVGAVLNLGFLCHFFVHFHHHLLHYRGILHDYFHLCKG